MAIVLKILTLAWALLIPQTGYVSTAEDFSQFDSDPLAIYGKTVAYDVFRNDRHIGQHQLGFSRDNTRITVTIESDLAVRYLGVPVYRYRYQAVEHWLDGKFRYSKSRIKDNLKRPRVIEAEINDDVLVITDQGQSRTAPRVNFPSNHWHPGVLGERRLFHTVHGKVHNIRIDMLGHEKIALSSTETNGLTANSVVSAQRFRYQGGFAADVWYDQAWRWVQLKFQADDGSEIVYRCTSCASSVTTDEVKAR